MNGIQEVSGSIPLISTNQTTKPRFCGLIFYEKTADLDTWTKRPKAYYEYALSLFAFPSELFL